MLLMRSTGGYHRVPGYLFHRSAEVLISTPAFVAALAPSPSLGLLSLMSGIQSDGTRSQARQHAEHRIEQIGMTKGNSAEEQKQNTWDHLSKWVCHLILPSCKCVIMI